MAADLQKNKEKNEKDYKFLNNNFGEVAEQV
jgi:hypothetical protein